MSVPKYSRLVPIFSTLLLHNYVRTQFPNYCTFKNFQMKLWNKKYGNSLKAKTKVMCYALCVKTYSILVECQRPQHTSVTQH